MVTYEVPDMSCRHCVATITEAVREVDPAAEVDADLDAGRVTVRSTAAAPAIEAAMRDAGYPADPAG